MSDKAMCNRGPAQKMCEARQDLEKQTGGAYLGCDLLAPHNGPHHDTHYGVYWREDLGR